MYSIGEFSRLTGLSIKALRLYHEQGLLVPVIDQESGYRYYRDKMVQRARAIVMLKDMTFSLAEIAAMVADFDDDRQAIDLLTSKRLEIEAKVAALTAQAKSINEIIVREKEAMAVVQENTFEVEEKTTSTFLYASKRWKGRYEECDEVFAKLYKAFGFRVSGKPFNLYFDEGCMDAGDADIGTCVPIRKGTATADFEVKTMASERCLSLIHKGPYNTVGASIQVMI